MFTSILLAINSLLAPQTQVQLPVGATSAIHFSHFTAQYGGATDEKFIEERIDSVTLALDEELLFRDLLKDSRPVPNKVEGDLIRMVVRFDQSEGLVADTNGRWALTKNASRSNYVFELSAPAMIQLNELLEAKYPSLRHGDNGTLIGVPPKNLNPRRYHAVGKFSESSMGKITSVKSRTAWPPRKRETLSKSLDPRHEEQAIRDLLKVKRESTESLDESKVWFVADTENGDRIEGDEHGRMRMTNDDGTARTFDLSSSNFMDLDSLLTRLRSKAFRDARSGNRPPSSHG